MTRRELQPNELEQLSLYAFGLLDPDAAARVDARLERDPAWRAELGLMQGSLAELADAAPVPAGSAQRLLERVRQDGAAAAQVTPPAPPPQNLKLPDDLPKSRAPYGPLLALALSVAVVAGFVLLPRLLPSAETLLGRYQSQPGAVSTALNTKGGQKLGTAVRLSDGRTFVLLAASAPEGKAYQAWQVIGAAPRSLGLFKGRSFITEPIEGKVVFAVSVEPPAGSAQPTTTPILAQEL